MFSWFDYLALASTLGFIYSMSKLRVAYLLEIKKMELEDKRLSK